MFLPLGDTPNPRRYKPYVTWGLIAANAAAYLLFTLPLSMQPVDAADPALQEYLHLIAPSLPAGLTLESFLAAISSYDLFVFAHGYKPGAPELSDLLASLFLHGGLLHLAGNMLFLWIFGDNVEHRLGRVGFLAAYLATGLAATLAFALFAAGSMTPLVGASGAISGVLGLYFLLFARNRVKVLVVLFPLFMNVVLLPARWVLGFYVLVDNLLPLLWGGQSNVAYGAHLGGFVAGFGIALVGERLSWSWPWADPRARAAAVDGAVSTGLAPLREAIQRGEQARAIARLADLSPREAAQLTPGECVQLSEWLDAAGYAIAANNLLRRCLVVHARGGDLARVYLALGLRRLAQGQPTAAYQHLLSVFDHHPDEETGARARRALDGISVYQPRRRKDR